MWSAGQGIVVFAQGVQDGLGYALKFYVERASFLVERDMYRSQTLGRLLPQVRLRRGFSHLSRCCRHPSVRETWFRCRPLDRRWTLWCNVSGCGVGARGVRP